MLLRMEYLEVVASLRRIEKLEYIGEWEVERVWAEMTWGGSEVKFYRKKSRRHA